MNLASPISRPIGAMRHNSWGTLFEIGIIIVIGIIFYVYLFSPKYKEFKDRSTKLADLTTQYNNLETQGSAFEALQQKLRNNTDNIARLDATLPLESHLTQLYVLLESLAGRAAIAVPSIAVQPEKSVSIAGNTALANDPYDQEKTTAIIPIVVSGTGTVGQINDFLHLLETNTRLLDVTSIEINQGQEEQLIFKVGLQSYVYASEEAKPASSGAPVITPK